MPRHVWAKVYCDLLRHPKIIGRPDSDVRLFLGLILYAKEYAPETGLVNLTTSAMRDVFGIKAPLLAVKAGVSYLVECGVLEQEGEHVRIRDFAQRQARTDGEEAQAERAKRYYLANREKVLERRKVSRSHARSHAESDASLTHGSHAGLTQQSHGVLTSSSHVEVEEEEERNVDRSQGGESEGRGPTACESVDKSVLASLKPEDRKNVSFLLAHGKASEATELLARLTGLTHLLAAPAKDHGGGSR